MGTDGQAGRARAMCEDSRGSVGRQGSRETRLRLYIMLRCSSPCQGRRLVSSHLVSVCHTRLIARIAQPHRSLTRPLHTRAPHSAYRGHRRTAAVCAQRRLPAAATAVHRPSGLTGEVAARSSVCYIRNGTVRGQRHLPAGLTGGSKLPETLACSFPSGRYS